MRIQIGKNPILTHSIEFHSAEKKPCTLLSLRDNGYSEIHVIATYKDRKQPLVIYQKENGTCPMIPDVSTYLAHLKAVFTVLFEHDSAMMEYFEKLYPLISPEELKGVYATYLANYQSLLNLFLDDFLLIFDFG